MKGPADTTIGLAPEDGKRAKGPVPGGKAFQRLKLFGDQRGMSLGGPEDVPPSRGAAAKGGARRRRSAAPSAKAIEFAELYSETARTLATDRTGAAEAEAAPPPGPEQPLTPASWRSL